MEAAKKTAPAPAPAAPAKQPNAVVTSAFKFLRPETTNEKFLAKLAKARKLAQNNAKTKPASEKISESEKAQKTPPEESQALSNQGQVKELEGNKVPEKTKEASTQALQEGIRKSVPSSLEAISDFKKSGKSQAIGRAVIQTVNKDVADVKAGFGGIGKPKAPAPSATPVELPPMEQAAPVEQINPGAGVLPPVEDQVIDNSKYVKDSDDLLKKEEISQENLDMVDKGDLAEANKGRKELAKDATAQPAAIKQMAAGEAKTLNNEMNAEERNSRADMQAKRQNRLNETGTKQDKTKTELEKKREEVAQHINKRYEACQKSITKKLDALEKNSLAQFDAGQERATNEFEDQVNADISRFKAKRYDRFGGSLLWAKDKLFGIDDFPEVKQAFDRARADFEKKIDALITSITKTNNEVIAACKKELEDTKAEIADYVSKLGPQLLDIGRKAQAEVGKKLEALSADIDRRKEKLQQALADKRKAAMEAIDKKIAAMKEAMSGLLSKIGNLLLEAAKKFFKWALEKLGIDAESFMSTLAKAGAAIKAIFKSPSKFFSNLIDAVKGSINDFKNNFKTYIISALVDWLTGSLGSVGIQIPKEFTVRSVIGMLLQVLGLTWAFFRSKLVALIGEEKVAWAEKAVDVVTKFVTGGVEALWDWIKEQAENIKNTFIESTKDWLLIQLVKGFAEWIVSLLIPGGAILKLVQGIYKLVMWFVDNMQRILKWVNAVLNSLGNIALGAISAAVGFIVAGIRAIIPAILDFFAKLLNISGIVEAVKKIIKKVSDPIHKAIDTVINWVVEKVKKLFGKGKDGKPDQRTEAEKKRDLDAAIRESQSLLDNPKITSKQMIKLLPAIKKKYRLKELTLVKESENKNSETDHVTGEINPTKNSSPVTKTTATGALTASTKVIKKEASAKSQAKLKGVEGDWEKYELGAMQNVVVGELIPEWEDQTGVPITTGETNLESAQYKARFKTQKGMRVGSRRPRPEGRVEIKEQGGKGAISHVFVVEVTTVRDLTDTSGESGAPVRHKLAQIPNTIEALISKYKESEPEIEYTIICPRDISDEEEKIIEGLLNRPDAKKIKVVWVKTGA